MLTRITSKPASGLRTITSIFRQIGQQELLPLQRQVGRRATRIVVTNHCDSRCDKDGTYTDVLMT
jgi:hypothetical protein